MLNVNCGSQESVQLYVRSSVLLWSDGGDGEDGRCRCRHRHRGDVSGGGGGQISAEKELGRRKVKKEVKLFQMFHGYGTHNSHSQTPKHQAGPGRAVKLEQKQTFATKLLGIPKSQQIRIIVFKHEKIIYPLPGLKYHLSLPDI